MAGGSRSSCLGEKVVITKENLSVTWRLKEEASDSIGKLYRAVNPGKVSLRGKFYDVASRSAVRHKIFLGDRTVRITVISHGFKATTEELLLGADFPQISAGDLTGKVSEYTFFNEDHTELITTSESTKNGSGRRVRSLRDGGRTLVMDYEWTRKGVTVQLRRVFERVGAAPLKDPAGSRCCEGCVVLVTGGCSFLGSKIVEQILRMPWDVTVRVLDIDYGNLDPHPRVEFVHGDVSNYADIQRACRGVHTVFHSQIENDGMFRSILTATGPVMNVRGTKNVLAACKEFGVQFLVYTSTADVVFSGADQENIDEEEAYCCNPQSAQLRSLVEAEKLVLEATCDTLNTCSIRPAMLYGPGDPLYWPDFLAVAKRLRTVFRPQCKPNLVDWVFVEHAAYAHCLAAEKLLDAHPDVAGHAFFVTDGAPMPFMQMPSFVWSGLVERPPKLMYLHPRFLSVVLFSLELLLRIFWLLFRIPILVFRHWFAFLSCTRTHDISRAKETLGYSCKFSSAEAMQFTLESFQRRDEQSDDKKRQ